MEGNANIGSCASSSVPKGFASSSRTRSADDRAGPQGNAARDALGSGFGNRFREIELDYSGDTASRHAPKILGERNAGLYRVDIFIGAPNPVFDSFVPANALDPIVPFLAGPEIEPAKWRGGKFGFTDEGERFNLVQSIYVSTPLMYNPQLVDPNEFTSWKDLLQPKWQGKLVMFDPRVGGTGQGTCVFWHAVPELGKEFMWQLFTQQNVTLSQDDRQILDWLVRGQYPVAIAGSNLLAGELIAKGIRIGLLDAARLKEGTQLSTGAAGTISVMNRAPHPNALKVFLNWFLSREGQTLWTRAVGLASMRLDVPTDHLNPASVPRPDVPYLPTFKERYRRFQGEVSEFVKSVLPS